MDKTIPKISSNKISFSSELYEGAENTPLSDITEIPKANFVRTMKNDILEASKKQEIIPHLSTPPAPSPVVARMDTQKKEGVAEKHNQVSSDRKILDTPSAPRRIGRVLFVVALILILLGGAFLLKFLWPKIAALEFPDIRTPSFSSQKPDNKIAEEKPLIAPIAESIIPTTLQKQIIITNNNFAVAFSDISSERKKELLENSLKGLSFVEEISLGQTEKKLESISANRFIMHSDVLVPEILVRSLETPFMIGFMGTANAPAPFLILKVSQHDTGLIGMYEWEQNIPKFFDTLFGTSLAVGLQADVKFRDVVILGHDSRILEIYPDVGIAYVFANPRTIVVTTNKEVLQKLLQKITSN
ncbi:MAG: hypothetical protein AAB628_00820 [Patescibacteria group bacterium]